MKNNLSSILAAVLGVAIGALAVLTVDAYKQRNALLKAEYKDWRKLNLILDQVEKNYVDSVDKKLLTDAAIEAALSKLDPHSVYMPPVERAESDESLAAGFDGIGIQFNVPNDTAIVIDVIAGGPSEKIGLLKGDKLIQVDDKVIAGTHFPQDSMVRRMKGPAGTKVTVTVKRGDELIPFEITRGKIPLHSVDAAFMVNDTTGYLRLSKFSRTTAMEVLQSCLDLTGKGMTHLVFDLRDNTGGYFDQALSVANMFLPKDSLIVFTKGRNREREDYKANGKGPFQNVGLTLLIDEGSASSSEIFAGAMQDNHRATIVGRRSFGKGLVQEPVNFTDGSGIRLTVARFYTPGGRCIQKPYSDDYIYEVYKRYGEGEMVDADSMKVEKGGIIPDVFVPIDTTKASSFYIACNKKATTLRFASDYFERHRDELAAIDDYKALTSYLERADLQTEFLRFAKKRDGLAPKASEWKEMQDYMMPAVRALVGRYSKLGEEAYYHLYLQVDQTFNVALQGSY